MLIIAPFWFFFCFLCQIISCAKVPVTKKGKQKDLSYFSQGTHIFAVSWSNWKLVVSKRDAQVVGVERQTDTGVSVGAKRPMRGNSCCQRNSWWKLEKHKLWPKIYFASNRDGSLLRLGPTSNCDGRQIKKWEIAYEVFISTQYALTTESIVPVRNIFDPRREERMEQGLEIE